MRSLPTVPLLTPCLIATCLVTLTGCRAGKPSIVSTADESTLTTALGWEELTLGPNDVLRVGVYGHPELSALPHANTATGTRIDGDGMLSLPLVGPVRVGGMPMAEAREAITAAFARYLQDPQVDVSVVEYAARRFYLYGEVNEPGAFPMDRPLNLYQGLSMGRGFTRGADRSRIILLRGTPENLEVHLINGEDPVVAGLCAIRPDDVVFVRRSGPGRFSDEALPILQGIGSALGSVATILLIEDQLDD